MPIPKSPFLNGYQGPTSAEPRAADVTAASSRLRRNSVLAVNFPARRASSCASSSGREDVPRAPAPGVSLAACLLEADMEAHQGLYYMGGLLAVPLATGRAMHRSLARAFSRGTSRPKKQNNLGRGAPSTQKSTAPPPPPRDQRLQHRGRTAGEGTNEGLQHRGEGMSLIEKQTNKKIWLALLLSLGKFGKPQRQ